VIIMCTIDTVTETIRRHCAVECRVFAIAIEICIVFSASQTLKLKALVR
jgi:hypothetical protein